MATIYQLPSGSWRVQIRRKPAYLSRTFKQRSKAESWACSTENLLGAFRVDRRRHTIIAKIMFDLQELKQAAESELELEFFEIALSSIDSARDLMQEGTTRRFAGVSASHAASVLFK
ncbi:hypothetical protein [Henriciella aquimarina]|uniref:hypothetical protein n=1 Tax=Henriciella aquimarina TaxID=545261 RepID=UPI000A02CADD|nr:hypothetical protein [Henriciella aquimarina]